MIQEADANCGRFIEIQVLFRSFRCPDIPDNNPDAKMKPIL